MRCTAPTCTVNSQSLPDRKDSSAKKGSFPDSNFLDFSVVEQG